MIQSTTNKPFTWQFTLWLYLSLFLGIAIAGCGAPPTQPATSQPTPAQASENQTGNEADDDAPLVSFLQPTDQAIVPSTFTAVMNATGLVLEPAGETHQGAGHFHILVDTDFIAPGEVVPKDEQHLHFGDAQTEAELSLEPGNHTLHLQFADGAHIALEGDEYQAEITVEVREDALEKSVRFVSPVNESLVSETVDVKMAATGLIVEPAGEIRDNAVHMHILVDTDFIAPGEVIPKDEQHLHFGDGSLKTTLTLTPGSHILRLQAADGVHTALDGDAYRDEITVTVE